MSLCPRSVAVMALALAATLACSQSPVMWDAERATSGPSPGASLSADGVLTGDTLQARARRLTPPGLVCPGSVRVSAARGTMHAVWWAPRQDSSAALLAARSADGGATWTSPALIDTTDHGVTGCRRAPPSIAADSASGYVHVAYGLTGAEGPGLFFAHSMDGGVMYHAPVPILYGERLGRTSVAADGDIVAVGFEDPNSRSPRVGLALSRTMGHIFEDRLLPVSNDNGTAVQPLVAIRGRRIAVAWQSSDAQRDGTSFNILTGTLR